MAPNNRADVGDRVVYTLTATNVGNVTLTGADDQSTRSSARSCASRRQPATLRARAPGSLCVGGYTLTQADLNSGAVSNTATGDSRPDPAG